MTSLQKFLNDYLALRRALGFKLVREGMLLPNFIQKLEQSGATHIVTKFAVNWAMGPKNPPPIFWSNRLNMVAKFAHYLHARDPRHEIPSTKIAPPVHRQHLVPYIYSDNDVCALMSAARNTLKEPIGETHATLIGLIAATGMRVGEVIALDRSDFNEQQGLLLIRQTKFGKTRQIPLHPSVATSLSSYAKKRNQLIPRSKNQAFFLSTVGTRLIYQNVHRNFRKLLPAATLDKIKPQSPRIHDLRHTFAIKTLNSWYRADLDIGPLLPALSTYLGHISPSSTYWYLHATPELLQLACQRLEKSKEGQP